MANFTAADVKRLREQTGAGMMDCKNALDEADGDIEAAIELLRLKGAKDVNKRATRTAANGLVVAELDGTQAGVLVELNCATDFVAKTDLAQQVAAMRPLYTTRDEVPADVVEKERRIAEQITRDEGKPEQAIGKIVDGRLNAYFKDVVLTEQAFVKDQKTAIKQVLAQNGVTVTGFARFQVGQA